MRATSTKLYLVDADLGRGNAAIALEGVDPEFESWLRRIDPSMGVERLLWDADSFGLDMDVVGTTIRRLSELGALGEPVIRRKSRPMRVAIVGHISQTYELEFGEWHAVVLNPWRRSTDQWEQQQSWDHVSELVDQVVGIAVDLVIYVANSAIFDALDLAFLRKLRDRRIPHLPIGLTTSSANLGPFVDFERSVRPDGSRTLAVTGICCDCWAQAQVQVDPDWANLLAHLVSVRETPLAPDMVRVALAEAGRWANSWWEQNEQVADLYLAQRVTTRRNFEWELASMGASETCRH